ncbi:MAG: hypothetical protein ACR2M4_05625 [Actinomycetota bacterium]
MTIQSVGWVLDNSLAELGARLALISIANHADRLGGNSYVSFKTIGLEARISRRAAIYAVQRLEIDGHIRIKTAAGPHGENIYEIVGLAPEPSEETSPPPSEETSPPKRRGSEAPSEAPSEAGDIPSFTEPLTTNHKPKDIRADSTESDFEEFWKTYPSRNGKKLERAKADSAWKKLNKSQRDSAQNAVGNYRSACDLGQTLAKDAFRWLQSRAFEDWLTPAVSPLSTNGKAPVNGDPWDELAAKWDISPDPKTGRLRQATK